MQKDSPPPQRESVESEDKRKDSWIPSSLGKSTVASCCYSVDATEDSEDFYRPAERGQSFENAASIDKELGLTEDYFSRPEGFFGYSTIEELEIAIATCKDLILKSTEKTERRKQLVMKLVQLRQKQLETEEGTLKQFDSRAILGHNFEIGSSKTFERYCDKCCYVILGVIHKWNYCKNCGFKCHSRCMNLITRVCAKEKIHHNPHYIHSICPEISLSEQKYRCAECKKKFKFKDNICLPRLCEYSGKSYCSYCHWNSQAVIPARVIHNWDFEPRRVCRASLQFLRLMLKKPALNIESLNPTLFGFVAELNTVKKLREDILMMKQYFLTCHTASERRLLVHLKERQHFVEHSDTYSLQDLIDITTGTLLEYLQGVNAIFIDHITKSCQSCRGKGFICELCKSEEILFPFYSQTESCRECASLFHRECYLSWEEHCPRCARRAKQTDGEKPQE